MGGWVLFFFFFFFFCIAAACLPVSVTVKSTDMKGYVIAVAVFDWLQLLTKGIAASDWLQLLPPGTAAFS